MVVSWGRGMAGCGGGGGWDGGSCYPKLWVIRPRGQKIGYSFPKKMILLTAVWERLLEVTLFLCGLSPGPPDSLSCGSLPLNTKLPDDDVYKIKQGQYPYFIRH